MGQLFIWSRHRPPAVDAQEPAGHERTAGHRPQVVGGETRAREAGPDVESNGGQGHISTSALAFGAEQSVRDEYSVWPDWTKGSLKHEQAIIE